MLRQKWKTRNFKGLQKLIEEIHRSVDLSEEEENVNPTLSSVKSQSLSCSSHFLWYHIFNYIVSSDCKHGVLGKQFTDNGGWGVKNHDSFGSILSLFKFDHI